MDTLHIFTIPNWLPPYIPPELWTIIFCWKWRLEMTSILHEIHWSGIGEETYCGAVACRQRRTYYPNKVFCYNLHEYINTGNKFTVFNGSRDIGNRIDIVPKCGIKFLLDQSEVPRNWTYGDYCVLHKHITVDLGIACLDTTEWMDMIKLLRTV